MESETEACRVNMMEEEIFTKEVFVGNGME
jgi:hypothetical protein